MRFDPTAIVAMSAPAEGGSSGLVGLIPFLLIFVVFYFFLIAPQRKKQKEHAEMLSRLKAGDRVVTNGGIFGTVVGVAEDRFQLRIADQVKIEVAKHAVAGLQGGED